MHTSGTLYAHIRHTAGTVFLECFEKISDVPFVCHMCAHTWGAPGMLKNEKYGQFPFQRWHRRQNRTFLASCGSVGVLDKNHDSEQKLKILAEVAENRDFLLPLRKLSYRSEFLS